MSQTIKLKRGTTTPTTSNIVSGEVAIDTSAKKLYVNDAGTIKEIGGMGTLSASDIPNLPASKITSGTFSAARIPSLAASKITSGTFDAARIPNLSASKITSGTFDAARIPTLSQYIRSDANDTTTGNITIQKTTPRILLKDNNGNSGSYPEIEFETNNNQGVKLYHNEFDGELPAAGYGLVLAESDTNTQFPTTGTLSFNVLGEMYAGGTTLSSLNKVFHDGYHPNADKLTTARTIAGTSFDGTANINISYNNLTNKPTIPAAANNATITLSAGTGLSGGGNFTTNQSSAETLTFNLTTPSDAPSSWQDVVAWNSGLIKDTAVEIHGSGYLRAAYLNMTHGQSTRNSDSIFFSSTDSYIRKNTAAGMRSSLDLYTKGEVDALIPTVPDTSNMVTTNTAQTISGAKTFTANVGVSGNISANFYAFNGSYVNATADVRAPIFYDRNNTSYYLHADGTSVLNTVRGQSGFETPSGNGKGYRFWNSNNYKIYMSATNDSTWGGRAPYESTSDYNMYFRMRAGTNRGFVFRNDTTNVAGIDGSGNFNTSGIIKTGNGAASAPAYSFTADYDSGMFSIGSNAVGFSTGGTQRFKINSNGLLLTGTSSLWVNGQQTITNTRDIANVVNYQNTDGHMQLHRTGAAPLIINRKGTTGASGTSRGEILNFKSASTKIGRIGYAQPYGGTLFFATGNTSGYGVGVYHFSAYSALLPVTHTGANNDNSMDLGSTSARYDDVYATNGTIQTSDRNEKQDIQELTDAETRAAVTCKGLMRRFRWVDSVTEKGDDARYHFGAIAQDVEAAFTAEGLDAGDYGLFIRSTWWEHEGHSYPSADVAPEGAVEKTRLGIRYNQLFAFIIGAL